MRKRYHAPATPSTNLTLRKREAPISERSSGCKSGGVLRGGPYRPQRVPRQDRHFDLPIVLDVVKRINALLEIERT